MRHAVLLALVLCSGLFAQTPGFQQINLLTERTNIDQTTMFGNTVTCNTFPLVFASNYVMGGNMVVQLSTLPGTGVPQLFVDISQIPLAMVPPVALPAFLPGAGSPCNGSAPVPAPALWAGFSAVHTVDLPAYSMPGLLLPLANVVMLGAPNRVIPVAGGSFVNEWDVYIAPGTPSATQAYFQAVIPDGFADGDPNALVSNMMPIVLF